MQIASYVWTTNFLYEAPMQLLEWPFVKSKELFNTHDVLNQRPDCALDWRQRRQVNLTLGLSTCATRTFKNGNMYHRKIYRYFLCWLQNSDNVSGRWRTPTICLYPNKIMANRTVTTIWNGAKAQYEIEEFKLLKNVCISFEGTKISMVPKIFGVSNSPGTPMDPLRASCTHAG